MPPPFPQCLPLGRRVCSGGPCPTLGGDINHTSEITGCVGWGLGYSTLASILSDARSRTWREVRGHE